MHSESTSKTLCGLTMENTVQVADAPLPQVIVRAYWRITTSLAGSGWCQHSACMFVCLATPANTPQQQRRVRVMPMPMPVGLLALPRIPRYQQHPGSYSAPDHASSTSLRSCSSTMTMRVVCCSPLNLNDTHDTLAPCDTCVHPLQTPVGRCRKPTQTDTFGKQWLRCWAPVILTVCDL